MKTAITVETESPESAPKPSMSETVNALLAPIFERRAASAETASREQRISAPPVPVLMEQRILFDDGEQIHPAQVERVLRNAATGQRNSMVDLTVYPDEPSRAIDMRGSVPYGEGKYTWRYPPQPPSGET